MARVTGGVTGRPSGKIAGVIFGAARSRTGKVVTAREKVSPSNPNTTGQQGQRAKFADALEIVKELGPALYQDDWNRAVGQLPGFQALMSIMLNNLDGSGTLSAPSTVPLGDLHYPDTVYWLEDPQAGEIDLVITPETGANGTSGDEMIAFIVAATRPVSGKRHVVVSNGQSSRSDEAITFTGLTPGTTYIAAFYMRGQGSAAGLLSQCTWAPVVVPGE